MEAAPAVQGYNMLTRAVPGTVPNNLYGSCRISGITDSQTKARPTAGCKICGPGLSPAP